MKIQNKTLSLVLLFFLLLVIDTTKSHAQEDYEKWLKKQQEAFQEYKDKRDKSFTEFLKKEWREMQVFQGVKRDPSPKPKKMPVAKKMPPVERLPLKDINPPRIIEDIPLPEYVPPVVPDFKDKPEPIDIKVGETLQLNYFDTVLTVNYDKALKVPESAKVSKESISDYWSAMSRANYDAVLTQAKYYKDQMRLNDWGYGLLLHKIAKGLYVTSQNQRNLFVWYMLSKSGYEAKIGYTNNHIVLLLPSNHVLYGVMYFTSENKKLYVVSFAGQTEKVKTLYTYDGRYPGADAPLDLRMTSVPNIKNVAAKKELKFNYAGKKYSFAVNYNKNIVDFLENYPQTNLVVYFQAPMSRSANYSLLNSFKPIIEGKSETEAVNLLLRFVQTAFDYQTDNEQFGREKYLFPDETLAYPFSDCEDRSILFAYLVRNLLGLEVIGLDYPGHIATAVSFSDDIKGDYVMYHNKKYILCDPTYINADLGKTMPKLKTIPPQVIHLNSSQTASEI